MSGAQWYAVPMPNGRASRAAAFTPTGAGPFPNDPFFPNNAQQARQFEAAMKSAGKTVRAQYYDGASHDLLFAPETHADVLKLVAAFLTEQLAK